MWDPALLGQNCVYPKIDRISVCGRHNTVWNEVSVSSHHSLRYKTLLHRCFCFDIVTWRQYKKPLLPSHDPPAGFRELYLFHATVQNNFGVRRD
jgi:hypothetical protein